MYNALIALGAGFVTSLGLAVSKLLTPYEASLPGLLVLIVGYVVLARRTFAQLEAVLRQSGEVLRQQPPRVGAAMAMLRRAYRLSPWQIGIRAQIDAQLGMLYFLTRDFRAAQPLLKRAFMLSPWLAGGMLGVIQFKNKDLPAMRKTMGVVVRKGKKQGLAWNLYAYLLAQAGDAAGAMRVLAEGAKQAPHDPRVKESLLALQNGRKMKMRAYQEQWYQFQLERPPVVRQDPSRMGRGARPAQAWGRS